MNKIISTFSHVVSMAHNINAKLFAGVLIGTTIDQCNKADCWFAAQKLIEIAMALTKEVVWDLEGRRVNVFSTQYINIVENVRVPSAANSLN